MGSPWCSCADVHVYGVPGPRPAGGWPVVTAAVLRGIPMTDCRECTLPVRFVALDTGKALPVDPAPSERGNVCARVLSGRLHGYVVSKAHPADPLFLRFMPHHATCPERQRTTTPEHGAPALF